MTWMVLEAANHRGLHDSVADQLFLILVFSGSQDTSDSVYYEFECPKQVLLLKSFYVGGIYRTAMLAKFSSSSLMEKTQMMKINRSKRVKTSCYLFLGSPWPTCISIGRNFESCYGVL
ncbi:unnamed protein product [Ilex paraguariensis]|uniref:Uncharacterized protein n=1 Tax=Ilex paraguariensis TaxID=185542 RepID=A0ABC8QPE9_9AQUA